MVIDNDGTCVCQLGGWIFLHIQILFDINCSLVIIFRYDSKITLF